jgi:hypothetical protein
MAKKKPSHADAHLILELYDLRREAVMRESRKTIVAWHPRSFEDVRAITQPDDPRNAAWRQVSSYYEMAFGFARHGIVPADFLAENAGEGLLLYAKIEPHLKAFRKTISPTAFRNAEWLVKKSAAARERMKLFKKRIATTLAAGRKGERVPAPPRSKAGEEGEQRLPLAFAEVGERLP